ncbi:MAG: TIGR02186 family protein [Parvibaculaceae bacterium]
MKMRAFICSAFAGLLLTAAPARAAKLVTDLSEHQVRIQSNFTGTQILLFGTIEVNTETERARDRDVIVVVSGPALPMTVRRKERLGGIWVNNDALTFPKVPGYYSMVSTRPLEVTADPALLKTEQIGIDNIDFGVPQARSFAGRAQTLSPEDEMNFVKALIRNKKRDQLYNMNPGGIVFIGQTLFRATFDIPANVPVGLYTANVYLISDGKVADAIATPLYIDKSGLERFLYRFAHHDALLYGLIAVLGAAGAGWLGSAVLRRR